MKKKSIKQNPKEVFTVLGEVVEVEGKKKFRPNSTTYFNENMSRFMVGKKLVAEFKEFRSLRSEPELRYHMVLCGYISAHTGFTKREVHEAIMKLKFGIKEVKLLGYVAEVRRSISESGDLENWEAVELIEYDLAMCAEMEIRVPTAKELGYLVDKKGRAV